MTPYEREREAREVASRRRLLQWLAASPLLSSTTARAVEAIADPAAEAASEGLRLESAREVLDVFEMERTAQRIVPPAHWGYLQSGVDGDRTLGANHRAFDRWQLRPRRFVDVSEVSLATEVLGTRMESPVMLCPIGSLRAMHPEAEVAAARAARVRGQTQIVSTVASSPIEDIAAARGAPVWFQLYTTNQFEVTRKLLRRAEDAGCPVVAITVDLPAGRNTVTASRLRRDDRRTCGACHEVDDRGNPRPNLAAKPMFAGIDTRGLPQTSPSLQWDFIARIKEHTRMKVVIKGLEAREDAELAVRHGADGIIVSNHGGRALESGRGTIESLGEVVQGAAGRIPVMMDGGIRRGTDVYKALALGAAAVGIGRPYVWGLAAFGQDGVDRVCEILNRELRLAMVGCGMRSAAEIARAGAGSIIDTQSS